MEKHELYIECHDDNAYYSEARNQKEAIEMLERCYIPCYQKEEPNEYMLLNTMEIERVFVKIVPL